MNVALNILFYPFSDDRFYNPIVVQEGKALNLQQPESRSRTCGVLWLVAREDLNIRTVHCQQ